MTQRSHYRGIRSIITGIGVASIGGLLLCPLPAAAGVKTFHELPHAGDYQEIQEYDLWGNVDTPYESINSDAWNDYNQWDHFDAWDYYDKSINFDPWDNYDRWKNFEEQNGFDPWDHADEWDDFDGWDYYGEWDDSGEWDDEYSFDEDYFYGGSGDWDDGSFPEDGSNSQGDSQRPGDYFTVPQTWESGLGSADELDGRIVVVSIYLTDRKNDWDFTRENDQLRRARSLDYLRIAADWITDNAKRWGKYPEFIYDWEQYDDLYYEMEIPESVTSNLDDPTDDMNELIHDFVDPDSLLQEYDAENILFLAYVNTSASNQAVSYTIPYDDSLGDETMEICYMLLFSEGEEETPAAYAHEMLHTFGAPDLYTSDDPDSNYGIDSRFVAYCEANYPNEIMLTTYDMYTDEAHYDHISNELSEITAYYIGWTDTCREVEEFGLQESQHIQ